MEEKKRNSSSNSQCGCKILGQRGNTEMGRVSLLSCFFLERDPNTFFYRPKKIVIRLGDRLWVVKRLGNGPKTHIPLQFLFFMLFVSIHGL
jgi:hypothetical protein